MFAEVSLYRRHVVQTRNAASGELHFIAIATKPTIKIDPTVMIEKQQATGTQFAVTTIFSYNV